MKNTPMSIRLPDSTDFKLLNQRVSQYDMTKNAFVTEAVNVLMNIDSTTYAKLEILAQCLELPTGVVISNLLVGRIVEHETSGESNGVLPEFVMTRSGILKGQELYNHLYKIKYKR